MVGGKRLIAKNEPIALLFSRALRPCRTGQRSIGALLIFTHPTWDAMPNLRLLFAVAYATGKTKQTLLCYYSRARIASA